MSGSVDPLGIIELGTICARMRAANLDLFEALGRWATDGVDPTLQRLFAEAGHRHAWHAELWHRRSPAIPPVDADTLAESFREPIDDRGDRAAVYDTRLGQLIEALDAITGRVDPTLDPGTRRVIGLVRADLEEVRARLTAR